MMNERGQGAQIGQVSGEEKKMTKRHRVFTYEEKKINNMGRMELLRHLFVKKYDKDEAEYVFTHLANEKEKYEYLKRDQVRRVVKIYEMDEMRRVMENKKMLQVVDTIFEFKEDLDGMDELSFSNIEGLAVLAYVSKKFLGRQRKPKAKTRREALYEAIDLWRAGGKDWDKLMSSLS